MFTRESSMLDTLRGPARVMYNASGTPKTRSMAVAEPATMNEKARLLVKVPQSGEPMDREPETRYPVRKKDGTRMRKMRNPNDARSRPFGGMPWLNLLSRIGQTVFNGSPALVAVN